MSLHLAAQHLSTKGRGDDTELVHMTKGEVAGLHALAKRHGGSLTRNPETGLTEAGFLSNILPAIVGGATAIFAPEALPWVAGGLGLATASKTGSLGSGIAAGLGAYGAGTLTAGVAGLGATTAASNLAAQDIASGYGSQIATDAAGNAVEGNAQDALLNRTADSVAQSGLNNTLATGASAAASDPSALASQMGGWGSVAKAAGMAAAPILASSMANGATNPGAGSNTGTIDPYTFSRNQVPASKMTPPLIGAKYQPGQDTSQRQYFNNEYTAGTPYQYTAAEGGQVPGYAPGGMVSPKPDMTSVGGNMNAPMAYNHSRVFATPTQAPVPQHVLKMAGGGMPSVSPNGINQPIDPSTGMPYAQPTDLLSSLTSMGRNGQSFSTPFAEGGSIEAMARKGTIIPRMATGGLGAYSDGGQMLKGPGDGMSDSIPATINQKQPARLANDEFVVPADVVSHLGNGSSDAGAKQLYAMMDRIRQARTGTKKQGKKVNPTKYMPA